MSKWLKADQGAIREDQIEAIYANVFTLMDGTEEYEVQAVTLEGRTHTIKTDFNSLHEAVEYVHEICDNKQ